MFMLFEIWVKLKMDLNRFQFAFGLSDGCLTLSDPYSNKICPGRGGCANSPFSQYKYNWMVAKCNSYYDFNLLAMLQFNV